MNNPVKLIKIASFSFIILIVLVYSYYQTQEYLKGPVLEVTEPVANSTQSQNKITVKGYAKNISYLSMDGRQIFTNPSGEFSEDILLSKGYNIIDISAQDKYEREKQVVLQLVYK